METGYGYVVHQDLRLWCDDAMTIKQCCDVAVTTMMQWHDKNIAR